MVVIQLLIVASETVGGAVHITMTMFECDGVERTLLADRDLWSEPGEDYGPTAVIEALRKAL